MIKKIVGTTFKLLWTQLSPDELCQISLLRHTQDSFLQDLYEVLDEYVTKHMAQNPFDSKWPRPIEISHSVTLTLVAVKTSMLCDKWNRAATQWNAVMKMFPFLNDGCLQSLPGSFDSIMDDLKRNGPPKEVNKLLAEMLKSLRYRWSEVRLLAFPLLLKQASAQASWALV